MEGPLSWEADFHNVGTPCYVSIISGFVLVATADDLGVDGMEQLTHCHTNRAILERKWRPH